MPLPPPTKIVKSGPFTMHFQHSGAREFEQNTDIIKFWRFYSVNFASCQFLLKTLHGRKNIILFQSLQIAYLENIECFSHVPTGQSDQAFHTILWNLNTEKKNDNIIDFLNYCHYFQSPRRESYSSGSVLLHCMTKMVTITSYTIKMHVKN